MNLPNRSNPYVISFYSEEMTVRQRMNDVFLSKNVCFKIGFTCLVSAFLSRVGRALLYQNVNLTEILLVRRIFLGTFFKLKGSSLNH